MNYTSWFVQCWLHWGSWWAVQRLRSASIWHSMGALHWGRLVAAGGRGWGLGGAGGTAAAGAPVCAARGAVLRPGGRRALLCARTCATCCWARDWLSLSVSQDCQEWCTRPTFITGQSRQDVSRSQSHKAGAFRNGGASADVSRRRGRRLQGCPPQNTLRYALTSCLCPCACVCAWSCAGMRVRVRVNSTVPPGPKVDHRDIVDIWRTSARTCALHLLP